MSIKDNLSNLITANGYDINNDEVRNALLSLAGSNIIKLPLDKKHIAVRTLSIDEYNKYIVNGTADGTIVKNSIDVYNHCLNLTLLKKTYFHIQRGKSLVTNTSELQQLNASGTFNYSSSLLYWRCVYAGGNVSCYLGVFDFQLLSELTINNNKNNCLSNIRTDKYKIYIYVITSSSDGGHYQQSNIVNFISSNSIEKNAVNKIYSTNFSIGKSGSNYYHEAEWNFNLIQCFRPIFNYIDNNKSKNIYY